MLFLMSDILDFAQIEAKSFVLNITRCNVEDLLHECLNVFKLKAQEKNLELNVQFENSGLPDQSASIMTDKNRLTQIIINLLSNALKYT